MEKIFRSATRIYRCGGIKYSPSTQLCNLQDKWSGYSVRTFSNQKSPSGLSGTKFYRPPADETNIAEILEREIQDEKAELNQLSSDQFPGFDVDTDGSNVKLTKSISGSTVTVRFTVSSSLNEWSGSPEEDQKNQNEEEPLNTRLLSMPEFQVQIQKGSTTLELSCYFEEEDVEEETGVPQGGEPTFGIDELVLYSGEPKESEFAVSAEYFQEDLQTSLLDYLAKHGIDDNFARNLIEFATSYEKKQYIALLQRLKQFVSK